MPLDRGGRANLSVVDEMLDCIPECAFAYYLASLNSGHNSDLRACCVGVRSSSRPNLVPARPLHPCSVTWRSSLVANLSSTALRRALAIETLFRFKSSIFYFDFWVNFSYYRKRKKKGCTSN
jgi:hypothetical protein